MPVLCLRSAAGDNQKRHGSQWCSYASSCMAAIKLSKISSKCLYCLGVSVEIFSIRREESVSVMEMANIDICGENGEYHTLVVDGPIFKKALDFYVGYIIEFGDYAVIDVK